ncbi:MerR family transcriptional regulator [Tissierella carlieri]|jgi:flagellar operon protein (TIGR03826 family)|uniref:TIGR03826 family flagellar region protein n=1 Tax=Tissierella TaxID=41273 RepID=UPI000BA155A5|nr:MULTISPECIES: TIGR03826 family flagellar region protein [Tissierella]MBU5310739.1 MerR family transcriptional regulator [Tissierella carlieri]MDU5079778.1 MerR family transcriptional regulator [Bacillota bacterium]OZV13433.1 MerR family transcriptional regulator [Tissierella sp. P1]
MDIRNCAKCGKIYQYDGFRICHSCRKTGEDEFQKVKEYLYDNPGATISEVEEATGVDSRKIIVFLREGRLEIGEGSNLILECEKCGVSIRTGRFCDKCKNNLQRELGQVVDSARSTKRTIDKKVEEKFRVIDRYEKRK